MKKKLMFIIPSVITLIILLGLFYIQGLYPFNDNSIVQVDADYQFIPVLYRIYDFLHGSIDIIYDDIGFGNNIYISMIIQGSIFSPLSLLLYFTDRANIVNYFNIIIIVKMCLLSLTTYIYINKTFKVSEVYKIIFSVLYSFSGWVILNYFNIMWLDSVILFPLIVMFLNDLLNKEKYLGYVITLSTSLIISYYISYFILLFILFYSFIYIFLKVDKNRVKKIIFRLGVSTGISILISSFSLLPCLYQTIISSRFEYNSIVNDIFYNFMNKSLYLMFSSVFLVLFGKLICKFKKDKKNIYIYILLFILFGIGIVIEPINVALHMGSYWGLPCRYSFIPLFILLNGSLYYLSRYDVNDKDKYLVVKLILFVLLGLVLLYLDSIYYNDIVNDRILLNFDNIDIYKKILVIFIFMVLMIIVSVSFKDRLVRYICFIVVCLIQIFIYTTWCMYYNSAYYMSEKANEINENMDIVKSELDRYKMGYWDYSLDHGFIYRINTLDNWLHILPSNEIEEYKKLGYGNENTNIRSYGGTIFSDWLFNVKYLIDNELRDNDMYKLLDSYNGYYLYEYNYDSSFGLVYNRIGNENNDYNDINGFELHNYIYRDLFNIDNDIVMIDRYDYEVVNGVVSLNYNIDELGFLYIDLDDEVYYIKVDGEYIDYDKYECIIDLGLYDDDVLIEIGIDDMEYVGFSLGFIKYDDVMNLESSRLDVNSINNGYDINVYNDLDNGYLFLPINNIDGLRAYVNDNEVKIDSYINNFVSIKLDKGDNEIEIRYEMPLFKLGIVLSIVGIICLLLFNKISFGGVILNITYYLFIFVCLICYIMLYGLSLFKYYIF